MQMKNDEKNYKKQERKRNKNYKKGKKKKIQASATLAAIFFIRSLILPILSFPILFEFQSLQPTAF